MTVLSIITVLKDDERGLLHTMESLAASTGLDRTEVEWIIIDSSTDADAVRAMVAISELAPTLFWEPPVGIFEAMNTGLTKATADYVYFLNAGDQLRDSSSLASLVSVLKEEEPDWLFGQVAFINEQGHEVVPPAFDYHEERRVLFARGRFPPHQGTVVRRDLLLSIGGFDTRYRITADYVAVLRLSLLAEPTEMDQVLATFTTGGISTHHWRQSMREFHQAREEIFDPRGLGKISERLRTMKLRISRGLYESFGRRFFWSRSG